MLVRDHIKEIDHVIAGGSSSRDSVVLQSWKRCVNQYGLDPSRPKRVSIVPAAKLKEHREQSERLISIAKKGLQTLFGQVAKRGYVLLLTDQQGVTVDHFGDSAYEAVLRQAGLYLGSNWSENMVGTNAVGSCITTGEAVTIHETDHFDSTHIPLSCTACPIFDTNGLLSATLDISLPRSSQPKITQRLALRLVKATARRIELANIMAMMRSEWVLRFSGMPEYLDMDPEAAIALDGSGCILGMTHNAARILARAGSIDWRHSEMILGQPLSRFFELSIDDLPNLTRARPTEERVICLRDGSAMFGHAISPHYSTNALISAQRGLPAPLRALSGDDPVMRLLERKAANLANGPTFILIKGETGVGKERLARAIHGSRDGSRPFVAVNCADLRESAAEEALFGNAGAQGSSFLQGLIELANGGTLFLDEVGDIPLNVQSRLLRFLSEGESLALGSRMPIRVSVKVISATHRDLEAMVREGSFRQDLFFRLAGSILAVPPLRERSDFDWLVNEILRQRTVALPQTYRLTTAARMELKHRLWPGNIRELINTLDVAVAMSDTEVIELEDLPHPVLPGLSEIQSPGTPPYNKVKELETVLRICDWNIARTARRLGVNRSTVYRRMARDDLQRPQ